LEKIYVEIEGQKREIKFPEKCPTSLFADSQGRITTHWMEKNALRDRILELEQRLGQLSQEREDLQILVDKLEKSLQKNRR